jgi:hypothetical protein
MFTNMLITKHCKHFFFRPERPLGIRAFCIIACGGEQVSAPANGPLTHFW